MNWTRIPLHGSLANAIDVDLGLPYVDCCMTFQRRHGSLANAIDVDLDLPSFRP